MEQVIDQTFEVEVEEYHKFRSNAVVCDPSRHNENPGPLGYTTSDGFGLRGSRGICFQEKTQSLCVTIPNGS